VATTQRAVPREFSVKSANDEPRPVISSRRLRGEPVERRHAAAMFEVLNDASVYRFLPDDPPSLDRLERQYEFLTAGRSPNGEESWLTWILIPWGSSEPIGFVQATVTQRAAAYVAYVLHPRHWRQGYGREAVTALLDVVFRMQGVDRAIAEIDTRNAASIGLVQALGFRHAETRQDAAEFKGSTSHEHVYELTRADWAAQRAD